MNVALVFTDVLKGVHKCIIDLLRAVVRSRLVMEVNNI
jgi:hypothetical protein